MLIFVQSKERAKELFHELIYDGINVDVIHSDRTQAQVSWMEHVSYMYNNINLTALFYVHALFIKYLDRGIPTSHSGLSVRFTPSPNYVIL